MATNRRLKGFGTVTWPEKGVPTDQQAIAYLDSRAGAFDDMSGPYEYLRGKWPQLSRAESRRIQLLWETQQL